MMRGSLHKNLRDNLAARINSSQLAHGDRLPAERQLAEDYGVARSVVRQALAGLARDGFAGPSYPPAATTFSARASPGCPACALSPASAETLSTSTRASGGHRPRDHHLAIAPGDPVAPRPLTLLGRGTSEPSAPGIATHPLDGLDDAATKLLLSHDCIDDDTVERVAQRRIIGYHERVAARPPTDDERTTLDLPALAAVLVITS